MINTWLMGVKSISGWWFGTWPLWLSIYWEFHNPNWLLYVSEGLKPPTSVKWWTIMNNYLEHWHLYRDMICYCYKMMNTDLENWHLTSKHGNKNSEFQRQQLGLNQEIIDNTDMDSSVKQGGFHQFIGIWWDILGMCKLGVSSPGNTPEIPRCERTGQVYHSTWVCQWGTPPKK